MKKAEILRTAVERLEDLTKAEIRFDHVPVSNGNNWDGVLDIKSGPVSGQFKLEVKKDVLPSSLTHWMKKLEGSDSILVARYISNPAKALLEKHGINYLDIAGNCFIRNEGGIFWQIRGQTVPVNNGSIKHTAFNKNGIKLIYALLLDESLVNKPYRTMAEAANIAASTVGDILNNLKSLNYLVQVNEKKLTLANRKKLLSQWVTAFNQKLRPTLSRGKFRLSLEGWKQLKLDEFSFWGGEPAADLLTSFLSPGKWTIYSDLERSSLISALRVVPDANGNLEVLSPFWNVQNSDLALPEKKTVHPLLVYAELIGDGNDRNFEAAQKIYAQYLQDIFEQDN
jgi:hypothetical protein